MSIDNLITTVHSLVKLELDKIIEARGRLRKRGPSPKLSDAEVITMEIVGEYLKLNSDKQIYEYFKSHHPHRFPNLGHRTTFTRQIANLWSVKNEIRRAVSTKLHYDDVIIFDGFPIPTCFRRRVTNKNPLQGDAAFGYCAAKKTHYFGFKGNIMVNTQGLIIDFIMNPANIDERPAMLALAQRQGAGHIVIADKGLNGEEHINNLQSLGANPIIFPKKNAKKGPPQQELRLAKKIRARVETTIGQLVERFGIQRMRVRDRWHALAKVGRKLLAHTVCFALAGTAVFDGLVEGSGG